MMYDQDVIAELNKPGGEIKVSTAEMSSEDKLWKLKQLEYRRDDVNNRMKLLLSDAAIKMPDSDELCEQIYEKEKINAQISKLLED